MSAPAPSSSKTKIKGNGKSKGRKPINSIQVPLPLAGIGPSSSSTDDMEWQWVQSELDLELLARIYRLIGIEDCKPKCSTETCKKNPYCLGGLGHKKWDRMVPAALPDIKKRQPGAFVGIANSGRTCYMNAMIQVWYHNPLISAVFMNMSLPQIVEPGFKHTDGTSLFLLIQNAFGRLRYTDNSLIELTELIKEIKLNPDDEQDSHEVSKLILDKIQADSNPVLVPFIKHLNEILMGETRRDAKCMSCNFSSQTTSPFSELTLPVPKTKRNIKDLLYETTTKHETIPNYNCSSCGPDQECESHVNITKLPLVLTVHLLRYEYARNYRSKIISEVAYPERLDMRPYVSDQLKAKSARTIYELTQVVHHIGKSAFTGHYTCNIKDPKTGKWFECDDSCVAEITENFHGHRRGGGGAGVFKIDTNKATHNSTTASILYYTRVDRLRQSSGRKISLSRLQKTVVEIETKLQTQRLDEHEKQLARKKHVQAAYASSVETKQPENISQFQAEIDGSYEFIPVQWLKEWMQHNFKNLPIQPFIEQILCEHGKVRPPGLMEMSLNYKAVKSEIANCFYQEFGKLQNSDDVPLSRLGISESLCLECGKVRFEEFRLAITGEELKKPESTTDLELNCPAKYNSQDEDVDSESMYIDSPEKEKSRMTGPVLGFQRSSQIIQPLNQTLQQKEVKVELVKIPTSMDYFNLDQKTRFLASMEKEDVDAAERFLLYAYTREINEEYKLPCSSFGQDNSNSDCGTFAEKDEDLDSGTNEAEPIETLHERASVPLPYPIQPESESTRELNGPAEYSSQDEDNDEEPSECMDIDIPEKENSRSTDPVPDLQLSSEVIKPLAKSLQQNEEVKLEFVEIPTSMDYFHLHEKPVRVKTVIPPKDNPKFRAKNSTHLLTSLGEVDVHAVKRFLLHAKEIDEESKPPCSSFGQDNFNSVCGSFAKKDPHLDTGTTEDEPIKMLHERESYPLQHQLLPETKNRNFLANLNELYTNSAETFNLLITINEMKVEAKYKCKLAHLIHFLGEFDRTLVKKLRILMNEIKPQVQNEPLIMVQNSVDSGNVSEPESQVDVLEQIEMEQSVLESLSLPEANVSHFLQEIDSIFGTVKKLRILMNGNENEPEVENEPMIIDQDSGNLIEPACETEVPEVSEQIEMDQSDSIFETVK